MTNIFVGHVLSSPDTSDESILPCALVYVAIYAMYIFKKYFTCLGSVYQRLSQISQRLIKPGSVCLLSHPSFLSSVFFSFFYQGHFVCIRLYYVFPVFLCWLF